MNFYKNYLQNLKYNFYAINIFITQGFERGQGERRGGG